MEGFGGEEDIGGLKSEKEGHFCQQSVPFC